MEIDWILVITFIVGMAVGAFSVAVAVAQYGLMAPVINPAPPVPMPPMPQREKPSLNAQPKYNPLTRKINHRN